MILFLDACILIYRLEEVSPWNARVADLLGRLRAAAPDARLAISRLSVLECRVKPMRDGNLELRERHDVFVASPGLHIVELDAQVMAGATRLRAHPGLRTADAIQAASCLSLGEQAAFISNDSTFQRARGYRAWSIFNRHPWSEFNRYGHMRD